MRKSILNRSTAGGYLHAATILTVLIATMLLPVGGATAGNDGIAPGAASLPANPPIRQIMIQFQPGVALSMEALTQRGDRLSEAAGMQLTPLRPMSGGAWVYRLPQPLAERDVAAVARNLAALPEVAAAEPDRPVAHTGLAPVTPSSAGQAPNDPYFADQWHYDYVPGVSEGLNLLPAWDITTGSPDIVVAVIDTGILPHADLAGRIVSGYDFITSPATANDNDHQSPNTSRDPDPSDPGDWVAANACGYPHSAMNSTWHGTHVAGTIGANSNNGADVAGIDWQARILPVRALGRCGGDSSDLIDAIRWAAGLDVPGVPANTHPARVINMSLSGRGTCATQSFIQAAIDDATAAGTVIVAAAGNDSKLSDFYFPASCNNVITVSAANRAGRLAWYSNYGSSVDVAAPGGETRDINSDGVLSTLNGGKTVPGKDILAFYQGTSMAAPHVAGVASLMLAVRPELSPAQVSEIIQTTARDFPASAGCTPARCGEGLVDAAAALQALAGGLPPPALLAPEDGATLATPQPALGWAAVIGADSYRLAVAEDDSFATSVIDTMVNSSGFTPGAPLPDGTYYWRVRAHAGDVIGPWSEVWSFSVELPEQCEMPGQPELVAPADGSIFFYGKWQPIFSWAAATNANVYSFILDTDPDLSDATAVTVDDPEYIPDEPPAPGVYYWAVTGVSHVDDLCTQPGPTSEVWSFTVMESPNYEMYLPATIDLR